MGNYKSIKTVAPVSRMGGTQQRVLLCPYADILTLQKNILPSYNIVTPHVPVVGKGFFEIYLTKDTGMINFKPQGAADRRSFMASGEFLHPGESDDIVSFANQVLLDGRWIGLMTLPGSTELIQVGTDEFQMDIQAEYDTTKNSGDGRGWTFEIECFMPAFLKYTASSIPMLTT